MFSILVVEDDRDLNRTVCAFLNSSGYQATGCLSGAECAPHLNCSNSYPYFLPIKKTILSDGLFIGRG